MSRMLGRSRSLRMLRRGGFKETHQQETDKTAPQSSFSPDQVDRLKAATPVSKADGTVETPDMLQRPKTSGGPGDRSTQFHKKVTPVQGAEKQGFEFPFSSATKSTTVLYAAEVHEEREGIIGIALGSPTMASHSSQWHTTPRSTDFVTDSQGTITHISSSPDPYSQQFESRPEAPKPKLSRWKSLFKKTAPPRPAQDKDTFYQLAKSVAPVRADSHHDNESIDSRSYAPTEDESRATSPPTYTYNPTIRESRKVPKGQAQPEVDTRPRALTTGMSPVNKPKSTIIRTVSSPKALSQSSSSASPSIPQVGVSAPSQNSSSQPLLDVDIPSVRMERYSVMFSGLLQQSASNPPSLLQRRQGNSEKLTPLNQLYMKNDGDAPRNPSPKPVRRATSPSLPPKSPSARLSLFPSANPSRAPSPRLASGSVNRPRPLQRSKTAPASSPRQQSFPKHAQNSATAVSQETKTVLGETPDLVSPARSMTPSSERSYDSDSEEITIVVPSNASGQPWKAPAEAISPRWEMITKPSTNTITKASALRSHPSFRQPSSAPLEPTSASRDFEISSNASQAHLSPTPRSADRVISKNDSQATVGVARSVSVSRANKPELLKQGTVKSTTIGTGGRLVDSKPLTPTLVELSNRKSQRVQLVDA